MAPRTHSRPLFARLGVMSITQIHDYFLGVFMYKLDKGLLPDLFDMFEHTSNVHTYDTR